jgi:uncharacterized damage-inducible protein DinB
MSPHQVIAHAQLAASRLINMMFADLTPQEMLHRPCPSGNCPAWILGHLILAERRFLLSAGGTVEPLPDGFEAKFARDELAPKLAEYGDVSGLLAMWNAVHDQLVKQTEAITIEQLETKLEKPHPMFQTLGQLMVFANIHATMHAGQVSVIRRSLGRAPLI